MMDAFLTDAARAVPGTARLFQFDQNGMAAFDFSFDGFLRSFLALLPVGVIYLFLCRSELHFLAAEAVAVSSHSAFYGWKMTGLVVDWFAFPLMMMPLSRAFGLGGRYVPVVVVVNWMSIIAVTIWAVPAILYSSGLIGSGLAAILSLAAFVYVVAVTGFTIKTALAVAAPLAMAFTALYLIMGLIVGAFVDRMIGL